MAIFLGTISLKHVEIDTQCNVLLSQSDAVLGNGTVINFPTLQCA